ncbi:mycothiol transferase [Aquimarina macrocephali]|uniref:mycothiol transferase n=1 Tax=Aquimarina macrocephali TaxID=666563 RepID=UPI003F67635A
MSAKKISQDWISFVQSIDIHSQQKLKFRIQASVKIFQKSKQSVAGLWVRTDQKDGTVGFFDNMINRPIISNQWDVYTIEGEINKNTSILNFGGICWHNGIFCFKNFKLFIQYDTQEFIKVILKNPYFENTTHQLSIPGWKQGTGKKEPVEVEEYTFNTTRQKDKNTYLKIEGKEIINIDTIKEEYSRNIGTLVATFYNLDARLKKAVQELSSTEIDYFPNPKTNSIGTLIIHLAAIETSYQVDTFEDREFNEVEQQKWEIAYYLGEIAQKEYQGYEIDYYLNILKQVRKKTLIELKKRTDEWLKETTLNSTYDNHYKWLHVLEHYSNHIGQILLLKKLIPDKKI